MTKILVTGGAGFIGSYITQKLANLGHEVIVFDAFLHQINPIQSQYNRLIQLRLRNIRDVATIIKGDLRNKNFFRQTLQNHKPAVVIHLAALAVANLANIYIEDAMENNFMATANLLEVVKDVGCAERIVYCSSSMVYGDFQSEPCPEDHRTEPKEIYGATKLAGEILVKAYGRRFGLNYVIVRPSAVYGPTDVNNRVIQLFIENAIKGKELVLHSGGDNKLDFTYVEDTAEGFVRAATTPEARNEIFNITRGEGRTLVEVVDILRKHFPDLRTVVKEPELHRPRRGALDISKARRLLKYDPKYSLEQGIARYVEFVRENPPE